MDKEVERQKDRVLQGRGGGGADRKGQNKEGGDGWRGRGREGPQRPQQTAPADRLSCVPSIPHHTDNPGGARVVPAAESALEPSPGCAGWGATSTGTNAFNWKGERPSHSPAVTAAVSARSPCKTAERRLGRQAAGRRACQSRRFPLPQGLGDWKTTSARGAFTGRGMGFTSTHRGPGGSVTVGEALAGCKWQEAQLSPAELKTSVCSVT